ncbi:MAG: tRNA dihydrouridine synthase DusB [Firmicutes bacterium]|nr:tRNA dihydrouridine synthase DusB [Bacillota bacterium]
MLSTTETDFLGLKLKSRVVLAPLAGVSGSSYRYLCHREGAALSYTEMISAKGLYYKSSGTAELFRIGEDEGPVGLQLFGSEPDMIAFAVKELADNPCAFFDINMGCPVPKVVKSCEGSALLAEPDLAARLVEAAVRASEETSKKAVTIKMRIGFGEAVDYVSFAKRMEEAGASAITVHGRTREQYYSGKADWNAIKKVKDAVSVPVIGNGDVRSLEDAERMLADTGCDLVMIGRASMGDPWVFRGDKKDLFDADIIAEHFDLLLKEKGEKRACLEMRKYYAWYTKGMRGAAELRQTINSATTPDEIKELINKAHKL